MTTQEIADELDRVTSVDINRRRISQQSLREVGTHQVAVRLGNELSPTLTITIVPEDELPEFLAARERGEQVSAEDIMSEGFRYAGPVEDASDSGAAETEDLGEAIADAAAEAELEPVSP